MSRDPLLILEDIENSCAKILRYTAGLAFDEVMGEEMRLDGILMNLQIVGEAVKNLPAEIREKHRDIPWREISGMRDFITHVYFALNHEIIWDAVQHGVPALLTRVREIIEAEREANAANQKAPAD